MNIDMVRSYDTPPRCSAGTGSPTTFCRSGSGGWQRGQLLGRVASLGDLLIHLNLASHGTARDESRTPRWSFSCVIRIDGDAALDVEPL
jgi:hypothetical protein